jgi:hypothetical protein
MTDRGAAATVRAAGERLVDEMARGDLGETLRLPELELSGASGAVKQAATAIRRLPDEDLGAVAQTIRRLPERAPRLEPIGVPRDSPIPGRLIEVSPFLERERPGRWPLLVGAAVIATSLVTIGLVMAAWRLMPRPGRRVTSEQADPSEGDAPVPGGTDPLGDVPLDQGMAGPGGDAAA